MCMQVKTHVRRESHPSQNLENLKNKLKAIDKFLWTKNIEIFVWMFLKIESYWYSEVLHSQLFKNMHGKHI